MEKVGALLLKGAAGEGVLSLLQSLGGKAVRPSTVWQSMLIPGAVGGGLGALGGAVTGEADTLRDRLKRILLGATLGTAGGAATGAGVYGLSPGIDFTKLKDVFAARPEPRERAVAAMKGKPRGLPLRHKLLK